MVVTRRQIVARGVSNRCPNCGERTLFAPKSLRIQRRCARCGTGFDRGEGFFLGPWVLNYGVAAFGVVIPLIVLGAVDILPWTLALVLATLACVALPVALYRPSWSWWLMLYFFFLPQSLPANGGPTGAEEED